MNVHGTFYGQKKPTFIWKVQLTRTIAVFGLVHKPTLIPANSITLFACNSLVRLCCNLRCGSFFSFENHSAAGPVACFVTGQPIRFIIRAIRYFGFSSKNDVVQPQCLYRRGAPPHIPLLKQVLRHPFGDDGPASNYSLAF
ncbi:hypothetical protein TNCV_207011 [Trichonephila clavipes]|nr:hypothetical protein TNCV_207011 [Trichonephila clavipes]